jgi:hypothetical protein
LLKEKNSIVLKIANLIAFTGVLVLNFLANYLPLNNKTTGELSDSYPNLIVPAAFAFAIWGVIYLGLGAFIIYQFFDKRNGQVGGKSAVERIGIFFILSCIGNMAWIVLWHYEYVGFALIAMLLILFSLIAIYTRVNSKEYELSSKERLFLSYPFSIYLGWITLATILNVTALLVDIGWNGFGISEQIWTLVIFAAILLISFISLKVRQDMVYNLVFLWGLFGIAYKHLEVLDLEYRLVYWGAIVSMIAIVLMIIRLVIIEKRKKTTFIY